MITLLSLCRSVVRKVFKFFAKKNKTELANEYSFPVYYSTKHYNEMTRIEKREYKRWLHKNNLWDGAEICERFMRDQKIAMKQYDQNESEF